MPWAIERGKQIATWLQAAAATPLSRDRDPTKGNPRIHTHEARRQKNNRGPSHLRSSSRFDRRRAGTRSLANANSHSAALFNAHYLRAEATPAGRAEKRLRLSAGRASLEQHRAAVERFGAGAESCRIRSGGTESARARSSTRESHGAALGAR